MIKHTTAMALVEHTFEGNTFEALLPLAEAGVRAAQLRAEEGVTGVRIEVRTKLTKAQRASLGLIADGMVSYSPGRVNGASSNWTRYSYAALVGGKFARRTKSVDALVEMGLADLAGSAGSPCPVVLTEAGRAVMGVASTPISVSRVKIGRRVIAANGAVARVVDNAASNGKGGVDLRLAVGDFHFTETFAPFATVPVLS